MPLKACKKMFKGWKALEVQAGDLKLEFTPEIGGRISGCSYKGHELFYTQPPFEGIIVSRPINLKALKNQKIAQGFRFYGGYKTWLAPQEEWPEELPFFDLDSGTYEWSYKMTNDSAEVMMKSPVCRESGTQLIKICMVRHENPFLTVTQTLHNASDKPITKGLWDVTQVYRNAVVFVPVKASSAFPKGFKVFDTENADEEEVLRHVEQKDGFAVVNCDDEVIFKVGTDAEEGWLIGLYEESKNHWIVFRKDFEVYPGKRYGHGCTAEIFNSDERPHFEMEIHAPVVELKPDEEFTWKSRWSFGETSRLPETKEELLNLTSQ